MTISELERRHEDAKGQALSLRTKFLADAASEGRTMGPGEVAAITAAIQQANDFKAQISRVRGDASMTAEIERLTSGMVSARRTDGGSPGDGLSLGAQFVNSETFEYLKKHRGGFPTGAWTSPASELMATTLDSGSASGGDLIVPDYQPGILPSPTRPLRMEDLIAPGTTTGNTVGYMKETAFTNAAATVLEGNPKPESTLVFDAVTDPVRKVPHWIPVTEEMLEDVPALRSYIDARLRLGVNLALDDELLNGALDTAPHITGFLNRTGLTASVVRTGTETNADAILDQIVAIELATSLPVDGIVMNGANWKTILKSKDGEGRYYGGGPLASPTQPVLWGRPVAISSAIVANTALVGAFGTAAQLFNRGGLKVEASNSHSDFFIRNLIAIRAERRAALAVYRPSAFGTVTSLT